MFGKSLGQASTDFDLLELAFRPSANDYGEYLLELLSVREDGPKIDRWTAVWEKKRSKSSWMGENDVG